MPTTIPRIALALALLAALAVASPWLAAAEPARPGAGPAPAPALAAGLPRWTLPAGARVTHLRPGVLPGEERHPDVPACRDFRLTERQALRFLALARVIDQRIEASEFNWAPCVMRGKLTWPGGSAKVTFTALSVGMVEPAGGTAIRLGCAGACAQAVRAEVASAPRRRLDAGLVEPGKGLGGLLLGDRRAAIHAALGPPTLIAGPRDRRVEGWPALDGLWIAYQGEVVRQLEWSGKDWSIPDGLGARLGPGTPVAGWLATPARWRLTAYRRTIDGEAGRAVCVLDDVAGGKAIVVREDDGAGGAVVPLRLEAVIVHPEQVAALPAPSFVPAPELAAGCPLPDRTGR